MIPPYATRQLVQERLPLIFPEGTPNRGFCVRELAASTVFTALYIGAVEGEGVWLGPVHVYRMTIEQAANADDEARATYAKAVLKKGGAAPGVSERAPGRPPAYGSGRGVTQLHARLAAPGSSAPDPSLTGVSSPRRCRCSGRLAL